MSRENREEAVELPSHVIMITRMLDDAEIEHDYYNDGNEIWVELDNGVKFIFNEDENLIEVGARNE